MILRFAQDDIKPQSCHPERSEGFFACVYFTVTVTFAVLPLKVLTVMTAVPFFSALTFPFWSTLATFGALEVQVRAEAVLSGSVAFSFSFLLLRLEISRSNAS